MEVKPAKRVTFHGQRSLVETLILDSSPLDEEDATCRSSQLTRQNNNEDSKKKATSQAKVTFVQANGMPLASSAPASPRVELRRSSQESYDNPFRPDGQLSQDVDPIVKLYSHKSPKNIKEDQIRLSYHGQQLVDDEDGSKPHEDGLCPVSVHLQEKSAAKGAAKGANGPKDGAGGDGADSAEKKKKHKACCSMM